MKNPNRKGMKLPAAGILYFIYLAYCAINILIIFIRLFSGNSLRVALGGVFGMCFDCVMPFLVMVALLCKMRNVLLTLPFIASVVVQEMSNEYIWSLHAENLLNFSNDDAFYHYNIIHIFAQVMLLPFLIDVFFKVDSKYNKFLKKLWFVPGIVMIVPFVATFSTFTEMEFALRMSVFIIPALFEISIAFTLAYWITNPYKKGFVPVVPQKRSRQPVAYGQPMANGQATAYGQPMANGQATAYMQPMTATQPTSYAQPQYQMPASAPQAASNGFCPACGNVLEVGDKFCGVCGAPVPEETQTPPAVSPTATEQIPAFRTNTPIPVGDSAINQRR